MLTKTKVVLSTLLLVGSTAAALAVEPEAKLGDRYPLLEQMDQQGAGTEMSAFAYVPAPAMTKGFTASEKALFDRVDEAQPW